MDKLKQFVDKNRADFENTPLPEGYLGRFEQRLDEAFPKQRHPLRIRWWGLSLVAAAIALLLLLRLPGGDNLAGSPSPGKPDELAELQLYYRMQVNGLLAQMEQLYQKGKVPGSEELLEEMKRIVQENERFEERVLPTLPAGNIGVLAITKHYGGSVESLSLMLEQMQQIRDEEEREKHLLYKEEPL